MFDARWRVWRPGEPYAGGGPAQLTQADDHAAPERAEGRMMAARERCFCCIRHAFDAKEVTLLPVRCTRL